MLDISPNLYEAKINLEDSKGSALFEKNLKTYNQLVEQEAKANRVSSAEVVRYMDETYAMSFEECDESGWEPDYEANLRDLNVPQSYDPTRGC